MRTSEYDERKKGWKRCECPVFVSGTLQGIFKRQNTGEWEWDRARVVAGEWEAAGSWVKMPAAQPPTALEPAKSSRITLADAATVFLTNRQGSDISQPTLRKYKTFVRQLTTFAASKGYIMLDQFTTRDIDVYYSTLKLGTRAKSKRLSTLRSFFRFCVNREWIPKTPVSADIKAPIGSSRVANKAPFSDEELNKIIAACDRMPAIEWKSGQGSGVWTGNDIQDFIFVMVYTGLRISDVGLFNMSRVRGNEVFLRAKKNGGEVFAYLPDWLRDRLNDRAQKYICNSLQQIATTTGSKGPSETAKTPVVEHKGSSDVLVVFGFVVGAP
jgi:integrase